MEGESLVSLAGCQSLVAGIWKRFTLTWAVPGVGRKSVKLSIRKTF